ncbi:MAG TPA: hypothetical protein VLK79_15625 [Gaiellales bacterium]|nr:hypothetical protein [Gaiellales bacterium]
MGQILVDGHGKAIYVFTADKLGRSVCVGGCLQFWPIVPAPAILPTQLTGITLGALARPDGGRQLTVDGSPVYTFARDTRPGSIAGQGRQLAGGRWWVLTPAGTPITAGGPVASPVPAPAPTTSAPPAAAVPAPAPAPMTPTPPAPAAGLPHNDGDADNNGGPNDGDGNI